MVVVLGFDISCFILKFCPHVSCLHAFCFFPLSLLPTFVILCPSPMCFTIVYSLLSLSVGLFPWARSCVAMSYHPTVRSRFLIPLVISGLHLCFWLVLYFRLVLSFAFVSWISLVSFFALSCLVLLPVFFFSFHGLWFSALFNRARFLVVICLLVCL